MERTYSIINQEAFDHFHYKFNIYRSDIFAYINIVMATTKPIPIIDEVTITESTEVTITESTEVTTTESTTTASIDEVISTTETTSDTTTTSTEMQYTEPIIPHIIDEGQNAVEVWLEYSIIRTGYINAFRKLLKMEPMTEHEQQIMHFVDIQGHWKL